VGQFTGKGSYKAGDLQAEVLKRVASGVREFTGKTQHELGNVSRELNKRRAEWITGYLGKGGADYESGDLNYERRSPT
jgi:nitric oxide reductase large subunit